MEFIWLSYAILSVFGSKSSAQIVIKTTSYKNNATFLLPKNKDAVVGFSPDKTGIRSCGFEFSVGGDIIHRNERWSAVSNEQWWPFLLISKKVIQSPYWEDYQIPEAYQTAEGQELTVSSSSEVQWQQISLPLEYEDTFRTVDGKAKHLTLPEKDDVWVAIRNSRTYEIDIDYQIIYDKNDMTEIYHEKIKPGWTIIAVSKDMIGVGLNYHFLKNRELKGRQLMLVTDRSADVQVIPMGKDTSFPISTTVIITLVIGLLTVLVAGFRI